MPHHSAPLGFPLDEIRASAIEHLDIAADEIRRILNTYRNELWDTLPVDRQLSRVHEIRMALLQLSRPLTTTENPTLFQPPPCPLPQLPSPPQSDASPVF